MIDPTDVTNYNRTQEELEEFLLFCVSVAGKTARQISTALNQFLTSCPITGSPFEKIRDLNERGRLRQYIIESKLGQHTKLTRTFTDLVNADFDLSKVTIEQLESIHGIGNKTSRYFILHTQPNVKIACLDTHILRYLGELGHKVPKVTPTGKKYFDLEQKFIEHCDDAGIDIASMDLKIWNKYSKSGKG